MNQYDARDFLELYQAERFEDQLAYYTRTREEFERAKTEAVVGSILLIFLAGLAGIAASSVTTPWLKLVFLLLAAVLPICSTTLAGYNALYGFEHQAKLFQDTINALIRARALAPRPDQGLPEAEFTRLLNEYVKEVEKTFQKEQGQWGQLAEHLKLSEA
jgi:hypothetical protein